jgi:hypothetical protein
VRYRGLFAYLDGQLPDGTTVPLCRLRYSGSVHIWGFAIYLASRDGYQDSVLPSGYPVVTAEEALDCACGLYLNDPSAWLQPPTTNAQDHLATVCSPQSWLGLACPPITFELVCYRLWPWIQRSL